MRFTRTVLLMVLACFAIAPAAHAATFQVTTFGDDPSDACSGTSCRSIRAAVAAAALSTGPDTVRVPSGDYQLAQGQILLTSDVTIEGDGARTTIVRGNASAFRAFEVPTGVTASITGVSLVGGRATDENSPTFYAGGLIRNSGSLTLSRVRVTGGSASSGGGIANVGGTMAIDRSLIHGNTANIGGSDSGGIVNQGGGNLVVRNTTIAFNHANAGGGAYASWGGSQARPNTALFEFVTIARNTAGNGNGGVAFDSGAGDSLRVRGSIIAANGTTNCAGTPESIDANFTDDTSCGIVPTSAPLVSDELTNQGGETNVVNLTSGSPALEAIPAGQCLPTDQRGVTRPVGAACDAGALEVGTAPPVVSYPAQDGFTNDNPLTIAGNGVAPGAAVEIFEGGTTPIGFTEADGDGNWSIPLAADQAAGLHTYTLTANDGSGDSTATTHRVTFDYEAPQTLLGEVPPSATNRSNVTFTFSSTEPGTFECSLSGPGRDPEAVPCDAGSITYDGLANGSYAFQVRAVDRAGNVDQFESYEFQVDSGLIAQPTVGEPAVEPSAATITFASSQAERTFRCRLEGPGRDGAFQDCASPQRYDGLAAGAYTFTVRSSDRAGNFADSAPRTFSVAGPPVQTQPVATASPVATPAPTPTATPTPTPTVNEDVTIRPTGKVLVKVPGTNQFIPVNRLEDVPLGSEIDTTNGRVVLRFESEKGKVQTATFYGGVFRITQVGKILDLKLTEPLAACPKRGKAATAQSKKKAKKRKLWGDGKGSFRTSGKYSAATVRGTKWLVEDSCAGTLTRVATGVVQVKHGKKTLLLRAGKRYLAKPR
ncbi:Ig-like domain-containing protein [Solirubrobacter pauli]|nr:Ig-like domain-containing protein [Solirubrobacter pauli]